MRFKETVNIGAAPTIQDDRSSLINRLEGFAAQQSQVRAQQVTQSAMAEGQASFTRGEDPEFKKDRFFGSVKAKAYNEGLRSSYVASIDRDNREAIAKISAENQTNLAGFNDSIEAYRKSTLNNIDPSARQAVQDSMDSLISSNRIRVQTQEIEKTHKENNIETGLHVEAATNDALSFVRNGDPQAAAESALAAFASIDGRVEAGFMTAAQGSEEKRVIERGMVEEGHTKDFDDIVDTQGFDAAYDELEKKSKKIPGGFTTDEWDSYVAGQQTRLNRKLARAKQEEKQDAKQLEQDLSVERGMLYMDPNVPADPAKGSQDRKDVNAAYSVVSEQWAGMGTNDLINNNVEFIKNTGIVPNQVIGSINAAMRSGNPEQVQVMGDLVSRLQEMPNTANVLRDIPDESRAAAIQISDAVRSGIDPETAIEIARKNTYGITEQQREKIRIETQAVVKELSGFLKDQVDDAFDPSPIPFFGEEPPVPSGMQADYNVAFEKFMTLTDGNPDQAKELAFGSLRKTWAPTTVGGEKRFMKNAPEAFYSVEGFDNDWMDDQFNEEMEDGGFLGASITSDFNTARSEQPSYPVITTNDSGIIDIVRDEKTGSPLRWKPDFKQTDEYKDLVDKPDKVATAKERRETLMNRKAKSLRRKIVALASGAGPTRIPPNQRDEFFATEEGKTALANSTVSMVAMGKADKVEAKQMIKAMNLGPFLDDKRKSFLELNDAAN